MWLHKKSQFGYSAQGFKNIVLWNMAFRCFKVVSDSTEKEKDIAYPCIWDKTVNNTLLLIKLSFQSTGIILQHVKSI